VVWVKENMTRGDTMGGDDFSRATLVDRTAAVGGVRGLDVDGSAAAAVGAVFAAVGCAAGVAAA
jgi:hypothetical protein